ncbi:MAG: lamin tail domain-containing protein [Candidatus Euphemobacter frigidus]|nr:lamin tail domain-containing protein [Candidatus Euphemobacter frigidus]MDP8276702.1 lamin tail domain-containing protein [Candidatus Euphemobacter frigidus]
MRVRMKMMKTLITGAIISGVWLVLSLSDLWGDGAMPLPPESPVVVGASPIRTWFRIHPTPTPDAYRTPSPTPTSTPKMVSAAWIPPEELFAAFGPGARQIRPAGGIFDHTSEKQEIIIIYPDRTRVEYDVYPETKYDPHKKSLSYSLLEKAYRAVYLELFGIPFMTPTPAPTPTTITTRTPKTPTPAPSPTPSTTPSPTPTSTPTPTPTATPTASRKQLRSLTPSPLPSPASIPGPAPFDLVYIIPVASPVWSVWADDRYLYGGAGDGRVYIWERGPAGFNFLETIGGYTAGNIYGIQSVRGSSYRRLYGASADSNVYAWDYDIRGRGFSLLAVLDQGGGFMYSVAGDSEIICGANNDGRIYLWAASDFSLQTVLDRGLGPMLSVCLDDDYIYGANVDGSLYLWDRETFVPAGAFSESTDIMWAAAVDSSYCYGGGSAPAAAAWVKGSFNLQTALRGAPGPIGSLSSDDRNYLYGAGPDGAINAWRLTDFSPQTKLKASGLPMNGVFADRYRPGDSFTHYIYGANADGNIYLWLAERTPTPTPSPSPTPTPTPPPSATPADYRTPTPPPSTTPSPKGFHTPPPPPTAVPTGTPEVLLTRLPSPSPTFGIRFFTTPTPAPSPTPLEFTLLAVLSRGKGWMLGVYADGDYIYGASEDKHIYIWDRSSYRPVTSLTVPDCKEMLSVYADGDYIYGSNDDSRVYVWDRRTFELLHVLGDGQYFAESVYADADYLYSANYDRSLYIWNRSDFNLQTRLSGSGGWLNSVFADTSRIYAGSGGRDYNVNIWDRTTFNLKKILAGPTDDLNAVRADNDYIYGASADSNIYLWDYGSFRLEKILAEPLNQVTSVVSGGNYIYGSSLDNGIYIWRKPGLSLYGVIDEAKQSMQWVYLDGEQIFGAARDGNIYVWQAPPAGSRAEVVTTPTPASKDPSDWIPGPTPSGEGSPSGGDEEDAFPVLNPTPPVYEWKPPAEPYDPHKETLNYPLLQETYKKVYLEFFNILLTTPSPPPTPVPTPSAVPGPTGSPGTTGDVVINEIAWGGTFDGTDQQWIELYNNGTSTVSLDGWKLRDDSAAWSPISFSSSYSIAGGGYFVLSTNSPSGAIGNMTYLNKQMNSSGGHLVLVDSSAASVDTVNCAGNWFAGDPGYSMERIDPAIPGSAGNWNTAPTSKVYGSSGSYGTPGARNSQQPLGSAYGLVAGASAYDVDLRLQDYVDWIDFANGHYFKIYEWDLSKVDKKYALYDYLPNTAFIYLVTGYKPTGRYFKEKLLELIRDTKFDWGGEEHCRYIADVAEAYLAMLGEGFFSKEERVEIEEKFYRLAIEKRGFYNHGNYAQGIVCGLNAVVGYIVGGKRGDKMISWANRLLSYDDTWTLPYNSRHYQGLFIREMLRVALYSNRMTIPDLDEWGVAWKSNFIRQVEWIIDTFPHNGYNPAYGRDYRQNYVDHYMAPLAVATTVLDDGNPDHIRLAREAKWLLQEMFGYGTTHRVGDFGRNTYGYEAPQWGPFAILLNPLYLYWYLNEGLQPQRPGLARTGSRAIYRPMAIKKSIADGYDESLKSFKIQLDKIIHRTGWEDNALFLMLDPAYPAAKSGKCGFANNIVSLSYGPEEFMTGLTMTFFNHGKTKANISDILGKYSSAQLVSWVNNEKFSRSVTRLKDGKKTWTREITLYKQGDRRIEVKDTLSRRGSVYWHFQGIPQWRGNGVVLDVNGTSLQVTWAGVERATHRDRTSWSDPNPVHRWCYSGDPDREVKLYRSAPGTITTIFRGL